MFFLSVLNRQWRLCILCKAFFFWWLLYIIILKIPVWFIVLNNPYSFFCGRCWYTTVQTTLVITKIYTTKFWASNIYNHTEDHCVVCAGKHHGIFWVQGISALWCHFSHFLWISRGHITLWLTHKLFPVMDHYLLLICLLLFLGWLTQQGEWNGWRIFLVQSLALRQQYSLWGELNPCRNALVGWGDGWWIPGFISKYPCLHVNAAVSHNILQLFLCMSNSAQKNENHKAPVWNLNASLPEMFSLVFTQIYYDWKNANEIMLGGCWLRRFNFFHKFKYQLKGWRDYVFYIFFVLLLIFICLFMFMQWSHVLWLRVLEPGRIFWENITLWSTILATCMTQGVVLCGCYKQPSQPLCVRSGCSLPLATAGDRMVGWKDLCSDTFLLSVCPGIYFSSTVRGKKKKSSFHAISFALFHFFILKCLSIEHQETFSNFHTFLPNTGKSNFY